MRAAGERTGKGSPEGGLARRPGKTSLGPARGLRQPSRNPCPRMVLEASPHDRAPLRDALDLDESRLGERADRALVGVGVGPARLGIARVALESGALLS